jgi:crotonobetainyl-CoA:carnitine CoA-transferase CaiB-like acyl-CoA transferase
MFENPILHNIRILDFTWVLAGPYATRLLADYGAEVIKVQPLLPSEEDDVFTKGYYSTWNRNKLGITLNLAKPEGIALAKKLAAVCDAVIENFTPRVMANFGLDYKNLKKVKSDIIMVSLSAMGQKSSKSHYTGYAPTVHALSGMTAKMSLDGKPVGPGFSYSDHIAGLYASMSLLAALEHRRQTGEGQHINLSETELLQDMLSDENSPETSAKLYLCKDGKWCAVSLEKGQGGEVLDKQISNWAQDCTAEELMSLLQQKGVASGLIRDAVGLAHDPQLKARGFFSTQPNTPFIDAAPIKMENETFNYRPAPLAGHDNEYVYGTLLGLSKKEITALKQKGVI